MKKIFFLVFILLFGCTPPEEQQLEDRNSPAYASAGYPTKWTKSFPLTLNISTDFDSDEIQAISNAANNWEDSLENQVNFFQVSSGDFSPKSSLSSYNDGFYGVYKVFDWPTDLPATALAVTQINGSQFSGYIRIDQADILINYDYYTYSTDDGWGYDLTTVVLHELGHFLGLHHDDSSSDLSVMYPSIGRFSDNKFPKENDIEKLASKYGADYTSKLAGEQNQFEPEGTPVSITLELYPNKEFITINGVRHEITHH